MKNVQKIKRVFLEQKDRLFGKRRICIESKL